ncbi:MAG: ATP-binding protein [Bacteroidota bacterium]|nr:ATP-binding protein [Bacteroidota bacterium]
MKKKDRNKSNEVSTVHVNYGKLLESKLLEWRGGYQHIRGIAEYISNSDDSYRRLRKFNSQKIVVSILSKTGRKLTKVTIEDEAEGMSLEDLENKFFQYYDSYSGREQGEQVTGRFGTGGKAYAIMNFKHCWITSTKNKFQCKFWFKWDEQKKIIIKGYNNDGYINKPVEDCDGTKIELVEGINNKTELIDFFTKLEKTTRIRNVLKSQEVFFNIYKKNDTIENEKLEYKGPNPNDASKDWVFELPPKLRNLNEEENLFVVRYFEKKLNDENFIDISDGISSVSDYDITKLDGRPFSKYLNGELIIRQLQDSNAVKENRKGLEEGNDLTIEIEDFLRECVRKAINEIEILHKEREKNRNIEVSNEKIKELNKFLKKCEMNFKNELKELVRKFKTEDRINGGSSDQEDEPIKIYRKPTTDDAKENLIKGFWVKNAGANSGNGTNVTHTSTSVPEFIPDPNGNEHAVEVGKRGIAERTERTKKSGLQVLMSDDNSIPEVEPPYYSEYDDPVSDRDMITKGIIWINANNPIIRKGREKKENEAIFKENVANYVLLVVSQY